MILIIDDDQAVRISLSLLLRQNGFETTEANSPEKALSVLEEIRPELILLDMNFTIATSGDEGLALLLKIRTLQPLVPVILITGWATVELAVKGMQAGARDFISKPWSNDHLLQSIQTVLHLDHTKRQNLSRQRLDEQYDFQHIVGEEESLLDILETVGRVSKTNASILIIGESGTGKELIAEAIHQNSLRSDKDFVKVNLGGVSTSLFESEMFGHKRGAFTDARFDRVGRFELADKGTIFLDEIGDLDLSSQVKLLRVLQDRTFEVLGSSQSTRVDVRVISATNRDLEEMVGQRQFREDLFYRINLITIKVPSLRERPGDIPLLVSFFINNLKTIYDRPQLSMSKAALNWLQALALPGNIRQLKNLVERTVLVSAKDELNIEDFQAQIQSLKKRNNAGDMPEVGSMTLEEMEIGMIRKAMAFHKNKIAKVAPSLGITRSALYRRLEKHGIEYED